MEDKKASHELKNMIVLFEERDIELTLQEKES